MYGLIARGGPQDGLPIKKPWRVACSSNSSLPSMLNKHCNHTHVKHALCAGAYAKGTQHYRESVVKIVHHSLKRDARMSGVFDARACSFLCFELSASSINHDMFPQQFTDQVPSESVVCGVCEEVCEDA